VSDGGTAGARVGFHTIEHRQGHVGIILAAVIALTRLERRWTTKFLLAIGGFVSAIVVLEVGLRVSAFSYPSLYTYDDNRGVAHRPEAEGWWRREGNAYVRINKDGLRDRAHVKTKSGSTLRIAVLGDSFAQALQVPLEETFWAVMERALNTCDALAGREVEAINFGVSNYGTAEELLTLRHHVWGYSPDVVLLTFFANDVRNNSQALEPDQARPFFHFERDELVLDASFRNHPRSLRTQSSWWRGLKALSDYVRVVQFAVYAKDLLASMGREGGGEEYRVGDSAYRESDDPDWQEAWRITEELIAEMHREVVQHGAEFLVLNASSAGQVHPDPAVRQQLMQEHRVTDLTYTGRRLDALGEQQHFPVLDVVPRLQAYVDRTGVCVHGSENDAECEGHWNTVGHRQAGRFIAETLCQAYAGSEFELSSVSSR
jgi:lysophospholipase L1-like esterase